MNKKIFSALAGAATGVVNGLFGAGGGLVLVPMLQHGAKLETKQALATSVAVILPLSAVSAVQYALREALSLRVLLPYLAGGLCGGILAGLLYHRFSAVWLRRIFGVFLLYAGVRMVFFS